MLHRFKWVILIKTKENTNKFTSKSFYVDFSFSIYFLSYKVTGKIGQSNSIKSAPKQIKASSVPLSQQKENSKEIMKYNSECLRKKEESSKLEEKKKEPVTSLYNAYRSAIHNIKLKSLLKGDSCSLYSLIQNKIAIIDVWMVVGRRNPCITIDAWSPEGKTGPLVNLSYLDEVARSSVLDSFRDKLVFLSINVDDHMGIYIYISVTLTLSMYLLYFN